VSADFPLRRLYDALPYLVDESVGVIQSVEELRPEAGAPQFFHIWARSCNVAAFSRFENFRLGGGAAVDRGRALGKAVGESIERYCSALFAIDELPLTSYADAEFPCVAPGEFALNSEHQYASPGFLVVPFTEDTPIRWAPAVDIRSRSVCWVPAAMVFVPYHYQQGTGDSPIVQPISTGLAAHCSVAEAAVTGLCEVIERDAFTITWQARMSRAQVRLDTLPDELRDIVARFHRARYSVTLLDVTMDVGVPTILALSRSDEPEAPALVAAAAADLQPYHAIRKSLEELAHTRAYCQRIKAELGLLPHDPSYENIVDQRNHLNFWADHSNLPLAEFLFASEQTVGFDDLADESTGTPADDLEVLIERVLETGERVLLVDLTTEDVRPLGFAVVRAVVPGFHPLVVGHHLRALGGTRLWTIPQKLGYPGVNSDRGDNPVPHPYP
jgi:ribosomal protein S12 methylthiotransferase accessory factor